MEKEKKKAFATLKKSSNHAEFLSSLGKDFSVTDEQVKMIEKFVCCLYGSPNSTDINDLRYAIFVGKKTTTESQNLPPCFNSLKLHIQRANYQAAIWVRSLEQNPNIPSPVGHGWSCEEGDLIVNWMDCQPAPDSVLELLACTVFQRMQRQFVFMHDQWIELHRHVQIKKLLQCKER